MAKSNTLWTRTAFKKVPPMATDGSSAKVAYVKIFGNLSAHRHYIIEYDHETGQAFVLTTNQEVCEFGYLHLPELQAMNDNFRGRFICPPWQREFHGTPTGGYNVADIQAKHAEGKPV